MEIVFINLNILLLTYLLHTYISLLFIDIILYCCFYNVAVEEPSLIILLCSCSLQYDLISHSDSDFDSNCSLLNRPIQGFKVFKVACSMNVLHVVTSG